ncbi:hypothetical protein GCM10009525_65950 [Streptosporangium amethystogenes subsp. fukuiense]
MGRISLVTMAKMPSMSEVTASQPVRGERGRASVAVDMIPVQAGARGVQAPSQAVMKQRALALFGRNQRAARTVACPTAVFPADAT